MKISIAPDVTKQFPNAKVGVLVGRDIKNSTTSYPDITNKLRLAEKIVRERFTAESISTNPKVSDWREAYRSFGCKPSEFRSSVEALIRRIVQGKELPSINILVDLYNLVSIKHILPAGGGDLDKVDGEITLKIATGTESFLMLGKSERETIKSGEVIYMDNKEVLCRAWNYRESEKTKITERTQNCYLVIEGLTHTTNQEITTAITELKDLAIEHCGGRWETFFLNMDRKEKPIIDQTSTTDSSEHEVRLGKVKKIIEDGSNPWPASRPVSHTALQALAIGATEEALSLAGRVMIRRDHGKTFFCNLSDRTGTIQLYIKKDLLGDDNFESFKRSIDLGDIIWVKGSLFITKTGELTVKVTELHLLSKCLHPLPEKFHGLTDIEQRYRQRYLDLMSNQESKDKFKKRSNVIQTIRSFLYKHDFMEVETPMLHPIPGGATARPFITHHNTFDMDLYLRVAPELYLKRLVIGGFDRVFEINRNFRNEGVSTRHNPEFTMLEFYMAYGDYNDGIAMTEQLIQEAVLSNFNTLTLPFGDKTVNLEAPFQRLTMAESIVTIGGLTPAHIAPETIDATLASFQLVAHANAGYGTKLFMLFEQCVEANIVQPTFIIGYPIEISPLSKRDEKNPEQAARFELFICGMEFANGFTELNDPFDQAERFKQQVNARDAGDQEAHHYDADYIKALEYGLPPTVGVGIGIDRLVMLLTNTPSIKDVILFPTLKRLAD